MLTAKVARDFCGAEELAAIPAHLRVIVGQGKGLGDTQVASVQPLVKRLDKDGLSQLLDAVGLLELEGGGSFDAYQGQEDDGGKGKNHHYTDPIL